MWEAGAGNRKVTESGTGRNDDAAPQRLEDVQNNGDQEITEKKARNRNVTEWNTQTIGHEEGCRECKSVCDRKVRE